MFATFYSINKCDDNNDGTIQLQNVHDHSSFSLCTHCMVSVCCVCARVLEFVKLPFGWWNPRNVQRVFRDIWVVKRDESPSLSQNITATVSETRSARE